jgi:pilus assembly protein TadC
MSVFKIKTTHWYIGRVVYLLAGIITLTSGLLVLFTGIVAWVFLALFVALMQIIFSLTGYCLSAIIMDKLGLPRE